MRDWDVWQRHPEYTSVIALGGSLPKSTVEKLEKLGFVVDDGSKPAIKAGQLFFLHVKNSLEKHEYFRKVDEYKKKYGEEPLPVHLEELPELIMRFVGDVSVEQCLHISNFALDELLKR
ncbi:hypothetical protein [Methanocella sp. MCL-LM]|uniref:hypothetical protein n=1 Tax=Methanocella sp. MCL-LM TaxID=3412035 RepID=UPI003C736727